MKKYASLFLCLLITSAICGSLAVSWIQLDQAQVFSSLRLPAGFPTERMFVAIWFFIFSLCGLSAWYILQSKISPKRKKNVLIILLILLGLLLGWSFLLFHDGNLIGTLAMGVAALLLTLLTMLMAWLVDHNAGYLLFPVLLWDLFSLYLNISLVVLN